VLAPHSDIAAGIAADWNLPKNLKIITTESVVQVSLFSICFYFPSFVAG